jgi:hypothetical protein
VGPQGSPPCADPELVESGRVALSDQKRQRSGNVNESSVDTATCALPVVTTSLPLALGAHFASFSIVPVAVFPQ